ncbi:hypothetical protein BI347_03675 [Chromobacterium sphagni]|uniref:Restriction endonuclease n=1 Tax=Chromobacterium sphagni TaxID=1903179 RepID=A0A1S1X5Z6_9NEIS|nr:hypothetical protein BI347_03675 [Chromobacterium sphagni]
MQKQEDLDDLLLTLKQSLKESFNNPTLIYGKRVESLFKYVICGLGNCTLVKNEDTGDMFFKDENLAIPDYNVILKDGSNFYVEVKNSNLKNPKSQYSIRKEDFNKLENYAKLFNRDLKLAIYFPAIKQWSLISKESMIEQKNKYMITMVEAIAKSEFIIFNDRMIGTIPRLALELIADENRPAFINKSGEARIIISDIKIYCADKEITEKNEKNIAFYLMRFGRLEVGEPIITMKGERIKSIKYEFSSDQENWEEQGFAIIGNLSSMISDAYTKFTSDEGTITSIDKNINPELLSLEIPLNYKGKQLPLWQISISPNKDFKA